MPKPRKNESRQDFMNRCIPIVMKEGGHKDRKKAAGKCGGIYDGARSEEIRQEDEEVKQVVEENTQQDRIVQTGGLLDGQTIVSDTARLSELKKTKDT